MTDTVTFHMPGAAVHAVREGNWPSEQPDGWRAIVAAPQRRRGKGWTYMVTLPVPVASDLADYLWSLAEVNTGTEGSDSTVARAARVAVERIESAVKL